MRSSKSTACPANYPVTATIGFAAFEAACVNRATVGYGQPSYVTATQIVPQQREVTMLDPEIEQRHYLLNRTASVQGNKDREMEKVFNIEDDDRPRTPEDLVKRITDGKYVITAKDEFDEDEGYCGGYSFERLHWRDPATAPNREGYKSAFQRMNVAAQKTNDKARLMSIADGYKAFEEFEATDFTAVN